MVWWQARRCWLLLVLACLSLACTSDWRSRTVKDCDAVDYAVGEPGYPLRLSTTGILSEDDQPLPESGDIPWFVDAQQMVAVRTQKYLIGQQVDSVRSPMFGLGRPQCPANPELATAEALEKEVQEGAAAIGAEWGSRLGDIEAGIDTLMAWPHSGVALKRILKDPQGREEFFLGAAKQLNAVPDLPTYTDVALARVALAGFEKGFGAGIAEAHQRAWLVNASVDVYFMVCGHISGALESAGAKVLDAALMRIRSMPIFVPGMSVGANLMMKVPRLVPKGSSRELEKALRAAKKKPLDGEVPHHTVAHTDWRAEDARKILAKFDVGLDTAENGVFLPGTTKAPNPRGKAVHSKVHTDEYYRVLTTELRTAKTRDRVIKILEDINSRLVKGGL